MSEVGRTGWKRGPLSRAASRDSSSPGDRLVAVAIDLDRTLLPPDGTAVRGASIVLSRVQRMGLRVVLVSGREHSVLGSFSGRLKHVDALVAENGAVVEAPLGGRVRVVGRSTGVQVRQRLTRAGWAEVDFGEVVASVPRAMRSKVVAILNGLRVDLVPNVDRVMVLPKGVSKATGMQLALAALDLPARPFAAIGDGENDLSLLRTATLSAAVRNAQPRVLESVDYVCRASFGEGVAEFVRGPLLRALRAGASPGSRRLPGQPRG
jgi:hydroxymethylpyrimidine pyrophosphatase-like HAD family hydrolase